MSSSIVFLLNSSLHFHGASADSVFPADVVFPLTLWSCVELDLEEIIALLTHCAELAGCLAGCGTATDAPLPC